MTIQNYAVINNATNICEGVILWDGRTDPIIISEPETIIDEQGNIVETGNMIVVQEIPPWQPPANCYVICVEELEVGIGWKYENETWIDAREFEI